MAKKFGLKIIESNAQIEAILLKKLADMADAHFSSAYKKLFPPLRRMIRDAIISCPEMKSVSSGILKLDFGIADDPAPAIADMIANSLQFNYSRVRLRGKSLSGGLTITLQPTDYTALRTSSVGITETEDGDLLPWLDWLLTLGDSFIIVNFGVQYGPYGRTGGARMVPTSKGPSVRPFQVNPNYSGNEADNFITRAIAAQEGPIKTLIMNILRG